ncbi:hypothetical protein AAF134_03345 [Synechococcus lacustris Tous-12m]
MPANQLLADGPPSGAEALGGVLSLDSLNEPTMPPAALVERARWQANANPLLPLPSEWRSFFRKALGSATAELAPAMQWHQPVAGLCTTELVPVLLRSNAKPITLRQPKIHWPLLPMASGCRKRPSHLQASSRLYYCT